VVGSIFTIRNGVHVELTGVMPQQPAGTLSNGTWHSRRLFWVQEITQELLGVNHCLGAFVGYSHVIPVQTLGVWVGACTLFWAVPHGHETAGPDQTVLDVDADVVVAVQKILAS
jgi:hypothetical protein